MKKILVVLALMFYSCFTFAQSFNLAHDHSTIQVKNIEKSVAFYKNIMHLKELNTPWPENSMIRFFKTGANQQLHIAQADFGEVKLNKVLHLAFSVKNFDDYLKFLNENDIKYTNFGGERKKVQIRPDGVRQLYFQDPDGYWIEINDAKHN